MSRRDQLGSAVAREKMRQTAGMALFAAALMLTFGLYYWTSELVGISDSKLYNASVTGFVWTLLIGGVMMLLSAGLLFVCWRQALLADAIMTLAVGVALLLLGLIGVVYGLTHGFFSFERILLVIFGAMFVSSARGSWLAHRSLVSSSGADLEVDAVEMEEPAAGAQVADAEARQGAMDRLLAAKRRENSEGAIRREGRPESRPVEQSAAASQRERVAKDDERRSREHVCHEEPRPKVQVRQEQSTQSSAPQRKPKTEEPAPEGFLAQLGKDDSGKNGST